MSEINEGDQWIEVPVTPERVVLFQGPRGIGALYVDGTLDRVGETYWVRERLNHLLGMDVRATDDFFMGGSDVSDVAHSLSEIDQWVVDRDAIRERARELDAQARELHAQAQRLREEYGLNDE